MKSVVIQPGLNKCQLALECAGSFSCTNAKLFSYTSVFYLIEN